MRAASVSGAAAVDRGADGAARRDALPISGFDTDNDTVFINETVKSWCEAAGVAFTRSRPYRKNDQAHIEQKNGAVVRRMVGYRRFEGLAATEALARLYRPMRLFVNFFQPSFKLAEKQRDGALIRKRYHAPLTPHQRLVADPRDAAGAEGCAGRPARDARSREPARRHPRGPAGPGRDRRQGACSRCGGRRRAGPRGVPRRPAPGLEGGRGPTDRTAEGGQAARPAAARPAGRTSPPSSRAGSKPTSAPTGRQLLGRLQAAHPDEYPDKLLRTVQRRLKVWRRERARELVLGPCSPAGAPRSIPPPADAAA